MSRIKKAIIFLTLGFMSVSFDFAHAHSKDLSSLFSKLYHSKTYFPGNCDLNIFQLIKNAHANGINIKAMHVLYMSPKNNEALLWPQLARNQMDWWGFHVALVYEGKIYDFDYTNSPTPIKINTYYKTMFLEPLYEQLYARTRLNRSMRVRVIPATEYVPESERDKPIMKSTYKLGTIVYKDGLAYTDLYMHYEANSIGKVIQKFTCLQALATSY